MNTNTQDTQGFVYFITNNYNIKIGFTKNNPYKRLKQLNTGSDNKLYLLGYMKGTMKTESELHKKFEGFKFRNSSEWFTPDDSIIDFINQNNEIENVIVVKNEYMNNLVMAMPSMKIVE